MSAHLAHIQPRPQCARKAAASECRASEWSFSWRKICLSYIYIEINDTRQMASDLY